MAPLGLFLDQGVPLDAAMMFRELGFACVHAGEIGMSQADDQAIIAWTVENSAVVLTLDAYFRALLAVSGAAVPSVVRVRIQGLGGRGFVQLMQKVLNEFESELREGALVTVKARKTTAHRLPIGGTNS